MWIDQVCRASFPQLPEHVWVATSGTSGTLKVVALSRAALEASARAVNRHLRATANDVWLNPLPIFHVGGIGMLLRALLSGARHEMFTRPWNALEFTRAAARAGATLSGLVPAQVHDLVAAACPAPRALRAVVVGGGTLLPDLRRKAAALGWPLLPSYGLTEAASQVATAQLESSEREWWPLLEHIEARSGTNGVLELCGPSLLSGWMVFDGPQPPQWQDPKCRNWYCTSDRVELRGRELRFLGRVDDLVKIRGELVDVAALERSLQALVGSGEVMLREVADARSGSALQVIADSGAAAREVRRVQEKVFPPYARPQVISIGRIQRTALGKVVRT